MKIIKKVTIKYFRSVYGVIVKDCEDLNVFSGSNDVGKSNIIKALNLFFNEKSDWNTSFDFYDSFSKKRLADVRESIKGKQFISIKLTFIRPNSYKNSLPNSFDIERKWYRDSSIFEQKDNLELLERQKKLPKTLATAQASLTKFLNKIHFEYVPAIKDRHYHQHLLVHLQNQLLSKSIESAAELSTTAENLAKRISEQILDLKEDFSNSTGVDTAITPPDKMSMLFQAFSVSTSTEYGEIPLRFRGDGLQARYIASALNFFSEKNIKFFIWGFEEPEIALEYSHAAKLATAFQSIYSKNAQIFLTSHSPAFISLSQSNVSRYRVYKDGEDSEVVNLANVETKHWNLLREELGIVELQKEVHEKYMFELKENDRLKEEVQALEEAIIESQMPLVLTEGVTDADILQKAYAKLFEDKIPFILRECDNIQLGSQSNGGAKNLAKMIETIHPHDGRKAIAIFDNDEEGRKAFKELSKNFKVDTTNPRIKKSTSGYAFSLLLPVPDYRTEDDALSIEFMFTDNVLLKKNEQGKGLVLENEPAHMIVGGKRIELPKEQMELALNTVNIPKRIKAGKDIFANEIVPSLEVTDFGAFNALFDEVRSLLLD